ncbi:MAG: OadG family protein, partial [Bacteroidota bacterium]
LQEAFILLGVGMVTVFLVLALVVATGQLIIFLTNRYITPAPATSTRKSRPSSASTSVSPATIAVLTAAVEAATQGQGAIHSVVKKKNSE